MLKAIQRGLALLSGLALLVTLSGCQSGPLLSKVSLSSPHISPNGDGVDDFITIDYTLSRKATISIKFVDAQGREYPFHNRQPRSAGSYSAKFYGTYSPDEAKPDRRVIPDGEYTCLVVAEDESSSTEERRLGLRVEKADNNPPLVTDVSLSPSTLSPNGDAVDDEATLGYGLSKKSLLTIYVADEKGNTYLLEREGEKTAALHSHLWNGTAGGRLLPDGTYSLHIQARDQAGNLTDHIEKAVIAGGGTPRLEITSVRFTPQSVPLGGILNVEIKVRNAGTTTLRTIGPPPGTAYDMVGNFMQFKGPDGEALYYERPGVWRVGVSWDQADRPYPVRWGLLQALDKTLAPGEEATITGTIRIRDIRTREVRFWAGVIQEGIGFGERVGQRTIVISY